MAENIGLYLEVKDPSDAWVRLDGSNTASEETLFQHTLFEGNEGDLKFAELRFVNDSTDEKYFDVSVETRDTNTSGGLSKTLDSDFTFNGDIQDHADDVLQSSVSVNFTAGNTILRYIDKTFSEIEADFTNNYAEAVSNTIEPISFFSGETNALAIGETYTFSCMMVVPPNTPVDIYEDIDIDLLGTRAIA